jgi:hypothetical protein
MSRKEEAQSDPHGTTVCMGLLAALDPVLLVHPAPQAPASSPFAAPDQRMISGGTSESTH